MTYGERAGLSNDMIDAFVLIIRQMDVPYRKWHNDEADRKSKAQQRQSGGRSVKSK